MPKKEYLGKWAAPEPYLRREKRPKIYSSYSISDKCELHSLVMDKFTRGCKLHSPSQASAPSSTSQSTRGSRAGSKEDGSKTERTKIHVRQHSTSLEDLDMISKLWLVRKLEEDTREALKDMDAGQNSEYKLNIGKNKQDYKKITTDDLDTSYVV